MDTDDLKSRLLRLTKNLDILREREAKYAGQAPPGLLNQIEDYQTAIVLYDQILKGQLTPAELEAGLAPLNLELLVFAPPPTPAALHQLPAPPRDFTGREAELAELTTALEQGGVTISGLRGMGGIGKTTLALKLAERLTPHYPDAQFYLDLRGAGPTPLTSAEALAHVIRAYHPTTKLPESEADLLGLYRSVLHGQHALLLMDNAASAAQIEPLLPPAGCVLLVTSRHHFHLPGLYAKNLDTLPLEDACALLLVIAPRLRPSPLTQLAHLCGCLPLALRLAASALAERPDLSPETYLRRLTDAQKRLDLIDASLRLTFDLLPSALQQLWSALSVFPADFNLPAAAAIWNLDLDTADERLGELLKYSLVEFQPGGSGAGEQGRDFLPPSPGRRGDGGEVEPRYRLHDLARLYADSRLNPEIRAEAPKRHAEYYADMYCTATELYKKGGNNIKQGLALFDQEWSNIQVGQAWAEQNTETNDIAATLCTTYVDWPYLLELRQHPRQRITWLEAALTATRRLRDHGGEGAHLGNLGHAYANLGETRRAIEYYKQQLLITHEISDRRGEGNALGNLGNAFIELGETRRAIGYYKQCLTLHRKIGDRRGEGNTLGNLGVAYTDLGETRQAIEYYKQHVVIAREIGDQRGEGNALGNLGNAYYNLGEIRRAIEYYEQQVVITREIGDRRGEGNALWNKALALDQLGNRAEAIVCAEASLKIREQIESPYADQVRQQLAQWQEENV